MKPRSLTLQAFGPFAGREVVDFTKLPSDALFLIHGPTGAGKSTLLDGICYALYGTTSGGERQAKEMRSHHAADNMLTEVELEFDLGARRYRAKRSPEQERAASIGTPRPVKVPAKTELHEWNGSEWNLLATKASEVSSHISTLLGFEADQFRQVIMLPQGQFRRLLSADSKDREKILEALFATEIYKRLQEHLQASARKLEESAAGARNKRTVFLQQAEVENEELLAQLIVEARQALEALSSEAVQRRMEADAAQKALSAGEVLAGKFKDHNTAKSALEQLNLADKAITADRQRHALALRAQVVVPFWSHLGEAQEQHNNTVSKVTQATTDAEAAAQAMVKTSANLELEEQKAPEREAVAREITRLQESRSAVIRLNEAEVSRKTAIQYRDSTTTAAAKLEQQIKELSEQRALLGQQVESLMPLAIRAETLKLEVLRQEQQLRILNQIAASESSLSKLTAEAHHDQLALASAQCELETTRQSLTDINAKWRAGQAAVLATYLAEGVSCPVCGSHEHPHPAKGGADTPSEAQLKLAADEVVKKEAEVEKIRQTAQSSAQKSGAAEATLKSQRDSLAGTLETIAGKQHPDSYVPSTAAAGLELASLCAERDQALSATVTLAGIRTTLASSEQQLGHAQQALDAARASAAEAAAKAAAAESVWAERASQVPENLRDPSALEKALAKAKTAFELLNKGLKLAQEARQSALSTQAAASATLKTLKEAVEASLQRVKSVQEAMNVALSEQGFVDAAAFAASRLTLESISALALHIQQHDQALATARERLARAEAALGSAQPPNLEELATCRQAAQSKLEAVLSGQNALTAKIAERTRTTDLLAQIRVELGVIEEQFKVLGHLAGIANGNNSANVTFQRYVLGALLDDVLRQASHRLKKMTSNRYTLKRFKDVSDRRRAAGLDIEVFDQQTGTARSANTLSGGEGFMASLSLALGLSDVVQGYAGGIQLDTLFIDEGFGTLDSESLDMAMKALIELQQKGRLVGIISHVDELKQQLEHGIEISFAATGSSVRVGSIAS